MAAVAKTAVNITLTCDECGSAVNVHPTAGATHAKCSVCSHENPLSFDKGLVDEGELCQCPKCQRKDFYSQKDFNRKIGVLLFIIAAIASIWTYGISLIVLYLMDLWLFRRLARIVICYKCNTIFRGLKSPEKFGDFDHEMNDRIIYADHDFQGKPL